MPHSFTHRDQNFSKLGLSCNRCHIQFPQISLEKPAVILLPGMKPLTEISQKIRQTLAQNPGLSPQEVETTKPGPKAPESAICIQQATGVQEGVLEEIPGPR
jgi:hypothetical protein